jgi:hypothetical protein
VSLRWAELVILTLLASPHLVTYDLLLLTVPLMVLADWAVRHPGHPRRATIVILLVLAYVANFSGSLVAMFTHVQASTIVLALLAWQVLAISTPQDAEIDEPAIARLQAQAG